MKRKLLLSVSGFALFLIPNFTFSQTAPDLGPAATFVLFSTVGAVSNVGISQVTGNVGSNSAAGSGFGNINGQMHATDALTAGASLALQLAYNDLSTQAPDSAIAPQLGNGQVLRPDVYSVAGACVLSGVLTLDGNNDPNAVFILKLNGVDFNSTTGASIKLINGALACNVFFRVVGATNLVANTTFRGNLISSAAIVLGTGVFVEGRMLTTIGAITVNGITAGFPIGCGSPYLTGPAVANSGTAGCYSLLTTTGAMNNTGISTIDGDVGTNTGTLSGFDALLVGGMIHPIPDQSTQRASDDLTILYNYLNSLPCDIELLYPAQFGRSQVLTPHVYCMNAAAMLTDTIFLDAQGNVDAVFVIKVDGGALGTSTFANVTLRNGTQAKNVFFKVEGAISIATNSNFAGTLVANNDAVNIAIGTKLAGHAFSTTGAINTHDVTITTDLAACEAALPLTILSFNGTIKEDVATISWVTENNNGASYFEVQKSNDLVNWEVLGTVQAVETSTAEKTYTLLDTKAVGGNNYYRLKQINKDGNSKYYGTITLNNRSLFTKFAVSVYPNPAVGIFNIAISVKEATKARVEILDIAGRSVSNDVINAKMGLNVISKSIQGIPSGTYLIRVVTSTEQITERLIIK